MTAVLDEVRAAAVRMRAEGGGRLAADEAGAIQHEHEGRHDRHDRCVDCGRDGRALLEQLVGFGQRAAGGRGPDLVTHAQRQDALARARSTDPETSHAAAASIPAGALTVRQAAVLMLFREHGWMTDEEVAASYGTHGFVEQSPSGLRTRRHELVEQGLLADTGQRRRTAAGNPAIVWTITAAGLRAIRGRRAA